ncbi:MAG: hypothetical protein LBQ12_07680 [Deltaproteobacteria bacterium]|jgi:hypothetical protein|nr:hypothetical protein [Deltaproteobacteria bacterium]
MSVTDFSIQDRDIKALRSALIVAIAFNAVKMAFILPGSADSSFRIIVVYEYDVFDPLGGEAGAGLDIIGDDFPGHSPSRRPNPSHNLNLSPIPSL